MMGMLEATDEVAVLSDVCAMGPSTCLCPGGISSVSAPVQGCSRLFFHFLLPVWRSWKGGYRCSHTEVYLMNQAKQSTLYRENLRSRSFGSESR